MANRRRNKRNKAGDILLTLLLVVAIGVFCVAGYQLFGIYMEYKQGVDEYHDIAALAITENDKNQDDGETSVMGDLEAVTPQLVPPMSVDFDTLRGVNTDVIGWIYMEAIPDINYPVVKGRDNSYYLHRTYKGEDNFAGTIFIDYENAGDFSDPNTLVYGHNMKNGSMFGKLKTFSSDPAVYEKSRYFWIFTPGTAYRYEIISAYVTAVDSDTYTLFHGLGPSFEEWLNRIVSYSSLAEKPGGLSADEKVVTLSTCTGNEATRYVVQGRRVDAVPTE